MASIWKQWRRHNPAGLWRPAAKKHGPHYLKRIMAPLRIEKRYNPGLWRRWNAF